jgi:hypothetical protein
MEWVDSFESSTILRFGYDKEGRSLTVEFKKSGSYRYFDVPEQIFQQMKQAPSKGSFFTAHVKPAYRYARL